jgi:hypothetical protein
MPFDEAQFSAPKKVACTTCKHFVCGSIPPVCVAFPRGIPAEILRGMDDHRQPVRGDHGVQYAAGKGTEC